MKKKSLESRFMKACRESQGAFDPGSARRFAAGSATLSGLDRPSPTGLFTRSVLDSVFTDGWSFTPS